MIIPNYDMLSSNIKINVCRMNGDFFTHGDSITVFTGVLYVSLYNAASIELMAMSNIMIASDVIVDLGIILGYYL